ncbi:MAG: glycoside hydrolase family 13 protein [Clostridia bacterium]
MVLYHHSGDNLYRTPPGAGACLSRVTLKLLAEPTPRAVTLRLWLDDHEQLVQMASAPGDLWTATIDLPETPGTLWYHFIADYEGKKLFYGNNAEQLGGEGATYSSEPPGYQITVYDPAYQTPVWMREGLIYQIMVDRFFASRPTSEHPTPEDGWLHADWYEAPVLRLGQKDNEANDFFGGDLRGVLMKLPYLKSLGVTALYFNPIFRARSNHKYDTGDYLAIDPSFGDESDFRDLCAACKAAGIRVMLDGVFSHTGADSRYFNQKGHYDSVGAYQSLASPYAKWYTFKHWPDDYESWWGFETLPNVHEMEPSFLDFIVRGEDSVAAHWVKAGSAGWRLDVADELPMNFLRLLRRRVKQADPDAAVLGEVWEDASNKQTYGEMRNYSAGDTLDSVMNYPLRDMALAFMLGTLDAGDVLRRYEHLRANYAPQFFYSLMNLLGSHDKPRIIEVLSGIGESDPNREARHARTLTPDQYNLGKRRYVALWRLICALPGMPCLYYGDEAGLTGMADPFCRATYPWGREDQTLLREIREINLERADCDALRTGMVRLYAPSDAVLVAVRAITGGKDLFGAPARNGLVVCAINRDAQCHAVCLAPDDLLPSGFACTLPAQSAQTIHL